MALVKVYNTNTHVLEERFRDQQIKIMPGKYIVMDEEEAHLYRCQFKPIMIDGDGGKDPRGFKMLRIEPHTKDEVKTPEGFVCHACNHEALCQEDLDTHIDEKHLDQLQDQELADKKRKVKKTG